MGNEPSQAPKSVGSQPRAAQSQPAAQTSAHIDAVQPVQRGMPLDFEGIPGFVPMVRGTSAFPPDLRVPPGEFPAVAKAYRLAMGRIVAVMLQNQDALAKSIDAQVSSYRSLSHVLDGRRHQLDDRLAAITLRLRELRDATRQASETLQKTINRADEVAAMIDPALPKFGAK